MRRVYLVHVGGLDLGPEQSSKTLIYAYYRRVAFICAACSGRVTSSSIYQLENRIYVTCVPILFLSVLWGEHFSTSSITILNGRLTLSVMRGDEFRRSSHSGQTRRLSIYVYVVTSTQQYIYIYIIKYRIHYTSSKLLLDLLDCQW